MGTSKQLLLGKPMKMLGHRPCSGLASDLGWGVGVGSNVPSYFMLQKHPLLNTMYKPQPLSYIKIKCFYFQIAYQTTCSNK